ncbi:hypothetical protein C495_02345 [Natronorubrum sulfidifaciens JCM 14089]|uniref:Uncharacterized protein n=1 Tax=Natronorubrum sulfidifaciens JCM 14089 TaxID=1230460 RepID=L9WFZ7_9EURY|nr:hypothetical protein C495_02345 [Natronorubrum sulfidifaciens JCM 14089]
MTGVVLDVDAVDRRSGTARVTPLDHRLDGVLGAFEDRFDAAVLEVFPPAVDAFLTSRVACIRTVVDALDGSGDEDVCASSVCHGWMIECDHQKSGLLSKFYCGIARGASH